MSKQADILEFEGAVKEFMEQVQNGEEITILKNGVPFAAVRPLPAAPEPPRKRVAGTEKGKVEIHGKLERPFIPLEDWNMLKD